MTSKIYEGASDIIEEHSWQFYGVDGEFYLYHKEKDITIRIDYLEAFDLLSVMCRAHWLLTYGWNKEGDVAYNMMNEAEKKGLWK